jgi:hypothetical protein
MNDMRFIDPQMAFTKCFKADNEREKYMYMYSIGNTHYFKHIDTRNYKAIKRKI